MPGFEEHMEACEDLFPLAEKARTILGVDMHLRKQLAHVAASVEIMTSMFMFSHFIVDPAVEPDHVAHQDLPTKCAKTVLTNPIAYYGCNQLGQESKTVSAWSQPI